MTAVRSDLGVSETDLPDVEVIHLFEAVDVDGGGEVSHEEFCHWIWSKEGAHDRKDHRSKFRLNKGLQRIKKRFRKAVSDSAEAAGWEFIFSKYDEDGEGGLDRDEFMVAIREGAGLSAEVLADNEIQELFDIVDKDESDSIELEEFRQLLTAKLDPSAMSEEVFLLSLYELATLWMDQQGELVISKEQAAITSGGARSDDASHHHDHDALLMGKSFSERGHGSKTAPAHHRAIETY